MSGQTPSWLMEAFGPKKGPSIIERLAVKMTPVDRLRFGGQDDIADEVDAALRSAYAEGRKDERENLERIGAVRDCPECGGRGERMVTSGYGPDIYQDLENCPDCKGTGYECKPKPPESRL